MPGIRGTILRTAAVATVWATLAGPQPVLAQSQSPPLRFDLPAQSLGSALRAFGQTANQPIIFSEQAVRGKQSRPLRGVVSVDDGLRRLIAGSGLVMTRTRSGVLVLGQVTTSAGPAPPPEPTIEEPASAALSQLLVTGSRIRRTDPNTVAPVTVVNADDLNDFGFTQFGDLLNQSTSNTPTMLVATSQGLPVLTGGRQPPNLFNLGPGRTLTLVNGRRTVTSASSLADRAVDANLIPTGLVQRVEIVQAGGAAVYGSDAIAGVVNYVLKTDFEGLELDAQYGQSTRGDYPQPALRLTGGHNFADGRANVAVNLEWSKSSALREGDRAFTASAPRLVTNPLNLSASDGQPPTILVNNAHLWPYNRNGVIFASPGVSFSNLLSVGGVPAQISADGLAIAPYDPGAIQSGGAVAVGGDGLDTRELSSLATGVERFAGAMTTRFDLSDHLKLSSEVIYGQTQAAEPYGTQSILRWVGGSVASGQGPIAFTRDNPFLSADQVATLSAASPAFATGGPLYLSRFTDILPTRERRNLARSGRALVALDGDFSAVDRQFYWNLAMSRSRTDGKQAVWAPYTQHMAAALNTVRDASGQIVCAINADATPANDDPACAPLNPFGQTTASPAARAYVSALSGASYVNIHDDLLASMGGDLARLPAGKMQFSLAYEHRRESSRYTPFAADQAGLLFSGTRTPPSSGHYSTNEYSAELLAPLLGDGFGPDIIERLEFSGSYRLVDHSLAGREEVWGAGLRLQTRYGLSLRVSRSRNFRAPTLDQQFAPTSQSFTFIGNDPCDADHITGGSNPAARLKNCQALFAAHPGYGPLANFQDPAENTSITAVTTGGNPNLGNEISHTTTWGLVFQPSYVPGLMISADRVEVELRNGLSSFSPASFLTVCYDSDPQPAAFCGAFTRDAAGTIVTARQTTFNAGLLQYRGEIYNASYRFPLGAPWDRDFGTLELAGEATHTTRYVTSVTGFDRTVSDGSASAPEWRIRLDARYSRGPLRLAYSIYYLPRTKSAVTDTIETTPYPVIAANAQHTLSVQYDFGRLTLRGGVINLTDEAPSFPLRGYGDIIGRRWFLGFRARY
ncbi:TonB-dependent receptor domain-containing protein [Caulobacter soli]|uniref:TonB-dependent receptor domain-containing protein n=1 Tax=Caulobacter soli TaxID=2708539 RepID=UPI0013EAA2BF|nr:TonB-dependent receptor [Caulobacter soli]